MKTYHITIDARELVRWGTASVWAFNYIAFGHSYCFLAALIFGLLAATQTIYGLSDP